MRNGFYEALYFQVLCRSFKANSGCSRNIESLYCLAQCFCSPPEDIHVLSVLRFEAIGI